MIDYDVGHRDSTDFASCCVDSPAGASGERRLKFSGLTATELAQYATMQPDWLVNGVFTTDEPVLVGARSKCCKTLQLCDLAVSLASGTSFLGQFTVPKRRRVAFISGEANARRMALHLQRACKARGFDLPDLEEWLITETVDFPQLPSVSDREAVARIVRDLEIEVVITDPLYRGVAGVDSSRLAEMGAAIKGFQAACQPATMIVSHHVVKSSAREIGRLPTLEDMTGAGIAESFGQWWLVGRIQEYQWDHKHDLCVQYGGREGQCGGKRIVFNEDRWTFEVADLSEFRAESRETWNSQKANAKSSARDAKLKQGREAILSACRVLRSPASQTRIRGLSKQSRDTFLIPFEDMVASGELVTRNYKDSQKRTQSGYILAEFAAEFDGKSTSPEMPDHPGSCQIIPDDTASDVCVGVLPIGEPQHDPASITPTEAV